MAKRSKRQVWERTMWAIQLKNGTLLPSWNGGVFVIARQEDAEGYAGPHEKPVKVRERIEVIE